MRKKIDKVVEMLKKFARSKGGDPDDPQFWYNLNPRDFREVKVSE
jgi:hypothetical protein